MTLDTWPSLAEAMTLPVIREAGGRPEIAPERFWCAKCGAVEVEQRRVRCARCKPVQT